MAPLQPHDPERFGQREAKHLLLRAGFGGTPEQIRTVASWGIERAVDHVLDTALAGYPAPRADDFANDIVPSLSRTELQRLRQARQNQDEETLASFRMRRQMAQRRDRQQVRELQRWWLTRMIETTRPLEEKMTLFWHGHFATSYRTTENSYHMFLQNQLFRKHALGNFAELLRGVIHDPAMLRYLNNRQNRKQRPNENLARELMELFSLGTGAYTEHDIKEGARALTGYAFEGNDFRFNAQAHDTGTKHILGARGAFDGDDFVDLILQQPACATFICAKLYRFFAADPPDDIAARRHSEAPQIIDRMAHALRANQYTIAPVLRELFLSDHFYSETIVAQRIKSPAELVVGLVRTLETPTRDLNVLVTAMDRMGQRLFFPPNVAGWPGERAWINPSTLYTRQNVATFLLTGAAGDAHQRRHRRRFDAAAFARQLGQPAQDDLAAALVDVMLAAGATEATLAPVRALAQANGRSEPDVLAMISLITALPAYQLC